MRRVPHNWEAIVPRIPEHLPGNIELDALLHTHRQHLACYDRVPQSPVQQPLT